LTAEQLAKVNEWRNARALTEVTPFHIWLQMAHRFLALVIAAGVITCLFRARADELRRTPVARFSDVWFLVLVSQITLGAWVIWSNKAADVATAHVALGAIMLALGVTVSALSLRLARGSETVSARPRHLLAETLHAS
jgi:cytochrome c oxidase assembly protein subunit 15